MRSGHALNQIACDGQLNSDGSDEQWPFRLASQDLGDLSCRLDTCKGCLGYANNWDL